jgi:ComF family protein
MKALPLLPTHIPKPSEFLDGIIICANYEDPGIQKSITAFKFQGLRDLVIPLSTILLYGLNDKAIPKGAVLIPIPLHRRREKNRGFNQSALLAQELSLRTGLVLDHNLKRIRARRPQHTLNRAERLKNLKGVFAYLPAAAPEEVLLIDDIATTYATLDAAAEELKKHGTKTVDALVIAKNQPYY